jgi:hypothetical protein
MHATCASSIILLNFTVITTLWSCSFCNIIESRVSSPTFSSNTLLRTLRTNILKLRSFQNETVTLGKWPTWRTILFHVFIFIFNSLHVSSTSCSSSGETNCVNTTSGSCRWPDRVQVGSDLPTCTRPGHRHRVTATRGCTDTICLSWW